MDEKPREVKLARTLGLGSIILLGVGALLGGGIFTLLGPAAGLAGPGLFLAMLLGGGVAFLNLQMYTALGTTFPEAGGGYNWIRKGLGHFQGFLGGWFDWFAHSAAGGLYALSFGYYVYEVVKIIWTYFGDFHLTQTLVAKIAASLVILFFGYLQWKGTRSSGKTANIITLGLVTILLLFVIFGIVKIAQSPAPLANFTPLLPNGWLGILAAAAFFYIAFEGSEIQVQTGEETKNPRRNLKLGLFGSWAIVTFLYLLISVVIIGATKDGSVWQTLAGWEEGAIIKAAQTFLPFGYFLMILGGLFANLAALNATIYSSSRVSYALARDRNIWSHLANIHLTNLTPHLAVIASMILMLLMVNILPLFDIASAASLLFVLLFLQLNIAGINIHYKYPTTQWAYKVPFFPVLPLIAIIIYAVLAATMLQVNLTAYIIVAFWLLLGLVNYFAYTETKSREKFETEVVYEESVRIGPKTGKRILWPISPHLSWEEIKNSGEIAFALASKYDGEIVIIRVHEIPPTLPLDQSVLNPQTLENERLFLNKLQELVDEYNKKTGPEIKDINFHGLIMIGRDLVDVILEVVKIEECDVLLLNWEEERISKIKSAVLGQKTDRLIRESQCDILVLKNPKPPKNILLAVHPTGTTPYIELLGNVVDGLKAYFQSQIELFMVIDPEKPIYFKPDPSPALKALNMKRKDFTFINFFGSKSIAGSILLEAEEKKSDLIIIGASWPRFLRQIRFGRVSEAIIKNAKTSVLMIKGRAGPAEEFFKKILRKFKPQHQ